MAPGRAAIRTWPRGARPVFLICSPWCVLRRASRAYRGSVRGGLALHRGGYVHLSTLKPLRVRGGSGVRPGRDRRGVKSMRKDVFMRSLVKWVVVGAMMALVSSVQAAEKGACKGDVEKLCKDVQPGEGRIFGCLKSHQSELSPKCASNVKEVWKHVSDACEPDVEKFCFDTPIGKGGIAGCLKKHSADLSADCKAVMAKAKPAK